MMKICIDARMLDSGGIGTYLNNLLCHFKSVPWQFYPLVDEVQLKGRDWGKMEPIVCSAPIYSIKEQIELPRKIPTCDLFWSPHYNIPLLPIRARKRLTTIHDVYHLAFYHQLTPFEKIYARTVMHAAVAHADQIVTVSHFSKKELEKYTSVAPEKVNVIYHGINHQQIDYCERQCDLENVVEKKFILFVGNLKPHKNLKGLIQAFCLLDPIQYADLHLVIIGKKQGFHRGENIESLLALAKDFQSRIHFLGNVSDKLLETCYRRAQALILPSIYEGFGFPPLEAMWNGCPVIASTAGSLPEICGEAASFIDAELPEQLAHALKRLLSDSSYRQQLIDAGKEHVKKYCWTACADAHLKLIEEMVNT